MNCLWKGIPVNCGPKGLPTDTNLLYHQERDGSFRTCREGSGIAAVTNRYSMTAVAADLDDDGWTDIYVASDSTAAILYRNNHDGTFSDQALQSGTAFSENGMAQAGMGLAVGDYNSDGRLDLFKTHFADDIPALYRSLGKGLFEDVATAAGLAVQNRYVEWGAGMPDLDNDGWPDLVYVTGNVYPEVEARLPEYPYKGPIIVFRNRGGDAVRGRDRGERTGRDDAQIQSGRRLRRFRQRRRHGPARDEHERAAGAAAERLCRIEPLARGAAAKAARSNRSAIGATVRVTAGGRTQAQVVLSQSSYYSHDDLRLHFGLGRDERADRIEVRWPSGAVSTCRERIAGQTSSSRSGNSRSRLTSAALRAASRSTGSGRCDRAASQFSALRNYAKLDYFGLIFSLDVALNVLL